MQVPDTRNLYYDRGLRPPFLCLIFVTYPDNSDHKSIQLKIEN